TTGMAGKWHLTTNHHGHYTHLNASSGDAFGFDAVAPPGPGSQNEGDKWVTHLTDHAIDFIRANRDEPWFYYLSHHTLHGKISAPSHLVERYLQAGAPERGLHNATYLACVEHLDHSIGRLLATLEELKLSENTIVVFLSDNGGVDHRFEVPTSSQAILSEQHPLQIKDFGFDNAPLREGKGSVYEGGIRVPCLVRWPKQIKPGRIISTPVHVVDWAATLTSAAGGSISPLLDGRNLIPLLTTDQRFDRSLYWYMPLYDLRWASTPCAAIRTGDYKLIWFFGDRFDSEYRYRRGEKVELFNLKDDLGETVDLSDVQPDRARAMREDLRDWIEAMGASVPQTNRHHDPDKSFEETRDRSVVVNR
ncbi:MAG: sulfatase-like hydrolase/transferase, partial [Planctomycetota bacterium]